MLPNNTIERLFLYRRILGDLLLEKKECVFSRELALISGASSEQVRRDLMLVGAEGHRSNGYEIKPLYKQISGFFKTETDIHMVLVGVGNLGKALLSYFSVRKPHFVIKACFDSDPGKTDRIINGCRCHSVDKLELIISELHIQVGIIAVPSQHAQEIADKLVACKILSLLNLTPIRLRLPEHIHVENLDLTLSIEKLGFLAKN